MTTIQALLLAARPRTLPASIAPVAVGTAAALADGWTLRWDLAGLALLGAMAIQVGTNFFNDAYDHERGADTGDRLGPPRATAQGLLTPRQVKDAGVTAFAVAIACGIPLTLAGGWPILVLGVLSLLFGWAYTGGPWPLAYHGLGEAFVLVFFGFGAVGGTYWLHAHALSPAMLFGGLQNGLLACALLSVNNLRDLAQDAAVGKRTLSVRLGPERGRMLFVVFALAPFALSGYWAGRGFTLAAVLPLIPLLPLISPLRTVLRDAPGPSYNQALARVAMIHLAFALLLSIGLTA